jgi:PAS domain S-box-containing protein
MIDERHRTILLVEDEALIAVAEKMTLEKYGFKVLTAYTGERAIMTVNSTPEIDLILMDIDLGSGIDGTVAAKKILETHDIPLVFLSSHTEPEVVEKTEGITSYGYIVKDSGETILIASIKMAFRLFEARMNEKKKEEAVIAEKDFNSLLINSTPAFFVSMDKDMNIMSMNTAMMQTLGYTKDEMIGKNYLAMLVPKSEHVMLTEVFNRLLNLKQKTFNENKIITKDGREILCEWYGTPILKENTVESFIGMGINITERRQIEQIQRIQQEIVLELNTCNDLRQGLEKVLKVILRLDCIDCGAIYIADPIDDSLDMVVHQGLSKDFTEIVSHFSSDSTRVKVILTGEAHYGKYSDIFPDLDEIRVKEGLRAFATIPIMHLGKMIAVLNVASHSHDSISTETCKSLETIALQIGGSLLRLRTDTVLLKNEEIFKQFMDNSPIYVFFKDDKIRPIRLSRNYEKMLGKPIKELLGKTMDELFPSELAKSMVADDLRVLNEGKPITIEEEFNGRFYSTIKFPIHIEGKPLYLSGYTVDTTDRKLHDKILQIQDNLFIDLNSCSDLQQGMGKVLKAVLQLEYIDCGAVYIADSTDGSLDLFVHQGLSKDFANHISRFDADSPMVRIILEGKGLHGLYSDIIPDRDEILLEEGLLASAIFPIMCQDQLIAVLYVASHGHDSIPAGTLQSLETITYQIGGTLLRLRADAALRESEELFRSFVHQSRDGIVIIDSHGTIVEWNESEEKITGIQRTDAIARPIWEVQYQLVPDEKKTPEYNALARKIAIEGLKEGVGLKRLLEDEIQRPDGSRRFMQTILFGIPSGRGILAGSICRDVTDQKLAEHENKTLLQEKTLLLKEVHHRIKNNIASIESLLSLQSHSVKNPEALSILKHAISRMQSMKILYDNLLISENYTNISAKGYFENLIDAIIDLFPLSSNIIIERNISDYTINSKLLVPIGIIVNELITNALKYAFTDSEQGILQITISRIENKISIIIADNGKGMPDDYNRDENKGFGYILVGMLIKQIEGSFSMIRENGTKIVIECHV